MFWEIGDRVRKIVDFSGKIPTIKIYLTLPLEKSKGIDRQELKKRDISLWLDFVANQRWWKN